MDNRSNPNLQKWISPEVQLGKCMDELKNLVRPNKEELVIIDPMPKHQGPSSGKSDDREPSSTTTMHEPHYMRPEASRFEQEDVNDKSEWIANEIESKKKSKWSADDTACEAAVAALGGDKFFLFGKKTEVGKKKRDGRKSHKAKEMMVEVDNLEDHDTEIMEVDTQNGEKVIDEALSERYNINMELDENGKEFFADGLEKMLENVMSLGDNEHMEIKHLMSAGFTDSDDDDDDDRLDYDSQLSSYVGLAPNIEVENVKMNDILDPIEFDEEDWLQYDNDCANMGLAQKIDDENNQKTMLDINDSDDSDEEDENVSYEDVDYEEEGMNNQFANVENDTVSMLPNEADDGTVNDKQVPCCSKSLAGPKPPSTRSLPSSLPKKRTKGNVIMAGMPNKVTLCVEDSKNGEEEEPVPASSAVCQQGGNSKRPVRSNNEPGPSQAVNNDAKEVSQNETKITDPNEDFKRFSEWAFKQNNNRSTMNMAVLRPHFMKHLNMTEDEVRHLQNLTSSNRCSGKGEVFQDEPIMQSSSMPLLAPPTNSQARTSLQSLAILSTHCDEPSVFPWKSNSVQQQMSDDLVNHEFLKRLEQLNVDVANPPTKDKLVNKEQDFLVKILIYQNTDPDDVKMYTEPRLAYELHILGSQTVKDLMGAFHCQNDYVCLKDIPHPDNYKEDLSQFAKARYPYAIILIGDTMYTDPKYDIEYVDIINKWTLKPPLKNIGPFKRGDWNTKLKDLSLKFRNPYVYVHLGGCEHIYVFTNSRLLHTEDDHSISSYPKIVGRTWFKNIYCRVDNEYLARWAVSDYKEFPENPMLLCTDCVEMYCYDKMKKKRGDFKLYPFIQLANIF